VYSEPTMPSTSKAQHRAMAAACTGKSTKGIPKKVGCEFMHADKGKVKSLRYKKGHGG
jgi:hypothetical protein